MGNILPWLITKQPPKPVPPPETIVQQLLARHNFERGKAHLGNLKIENTLQNMAVEHSNFMAYFNIMSHDKAGDGTFAYRISHSTYLYRAAGENVLEGLTNITDVMREWMNSPLHRANILGNFTDCGLSVAYGKSNVPYYCAVFGLPQQLTSRQHGSKYLCDPVTIKVI